MASKTTITVRDINPVDKAWLQREAAHRGMSMEAFVRQLIHEKRQRVQQREAPSSVFSRFFGQRCGADLDDVVPRHLEPRVDFSDPAYDPVDDDK